MVGVDIGSVSVKVVELSVGSGGGFRLEKCASELLPRGAVAEGNVVSIEPVAQAIRQALGKAGIRESRAVLALPATLTENQTISLPDNLSDDEMVMQVESEANRLFPPSQNVNFDFVVIGPSETEGGIGVNVTAAASDHVQTRVTAAEMAGLKPLVMDVEEFALQRTVTHMLALRTDIDEAQARDLPVVAVFCLGGSRSWVAFYQGWKELYRQPVGIWGDQLTEAVSQTFTLEFLQAEVKKRKNSLPDAYREQLLRPALEHVAAEVANAIRNFMSVSSVGRVDEIILGGGHASLVGLQAAVQQQMQLPTTLANPFVNMETAEKVNARYLQRDLPAYIVAAGLALRGLQQGAAA
ncbi:type IV pilus assembly protein PilM [Imbroritus primus]|uniref:Type IV pilus assembly protein PilM n=1 Tax=Imbroritus primus TaxID=3058603 RepID=A0ACD3ST48_9BURK|nr:type IV pilus assembly protein PilM [Burkholderiaceae bacterium PBA]